MRIRAIVNDTYIVCLPSAIIVHGAVPDSLVSVGLLYLYRYTKGHNTNMSDSANFRGIALSSVFGKVFDNIILELYHQKLSSCDMQLGFKPKSSTNNVLYGVERGSQLLCSTPEPCFLHISRYN